MEAAQSSTFEAAMDLGASRIKPFQSGLPGFAARHPLSASLRSFLPMSLDSFIVTHFTKGPGIDTLSTKIYTGKKGIKPEMYALSTLIFVAVLLLASVGKTKRLQSEEGRHSALKTRRL